MAAADSSSSDHFSASYSPDPDLLNMCSLTSHFNTWCREMDSDPDKAFILSGIAHGFHLVNDLSIVSPADCHNYRSAENPAVKPALDKLFQDELCFQRIEEVFNKPLRVNAIGSVTKKDTGEPRPITDMSRPVNNSVNDYISCESYLGQTSNVSLSLVLLIKSSAFGLGLTRYRVTLFSNTRLDHSVAILLSSSLSVLSLNFKSPFLLQRSFDDKSSKARTSSSNLLNLGLLCSRFSVII